MMRLLPILFLVVIAWIAPLSAQTIEVRSGEHETFTRLVLPLPNRVDVALERQIGQAALTFENASWAFATDTVFERVPRTRLTDLQVVQDGAQIILSLACKCGIETFWFEDSTLVVDVLNETPEFAALFPSEPDEEVVLSDTAPPLVPIPATTPTPASVDLVSPQSPRLGSAAFLIADALDRQGEVAPRRQKPAEDHASRVRDSQQAILREISRAAGQGLLSPRSDLLSPEPDVLATPVEQPDADAPELSTRPNISILTHTSKDRAAPDVQLGAAGTDTSGCLAEARVDINSWSNGSNFVDQVGPLRSRLMGEFDQPSQDAVTALARFYVHFGFGAEAQQVLHLLPKTDAADPVLLAMVDILEHGHASDGSALAGHMDCAPILAAWSALSYDKIPGNLPIDPDAVVRGFLEFPIHLRAYLGPILGSRLNRAGYTRAAEHIARSLLRRDETTTPAADFLSAQSSQTRDDPEASEDALSSVIAADSELSVDALIRLIDQRIDLGEPVSPELASLAGAYVIEYRGSPKGEAMTHAYLTALAASGAFTTAFDELHRLFGDGDVIPPSTRSDLMRLLEANGSDADFLTHAIGDLRAAAFDLEDDVANAVARRLISLGFAGAAEPYVTPLAQEEAERNRKVIRARIALAQGRPRQAELEVLGETGEEITEVLAIARGMAGEHQSAQTLFSQIGKEEEALRQAWLDGDWQTLRDHGNAGIAGMAERLAGLTDASEAGLGDETLARNAAMIGDSEAMRSAIEALLSDVGGPSLATEP